MTSDYGQYTFRVPRRRLNVTKLLASKALRITYADDGKGGFVKSKDPKSFSVVSAVNDQAAGSVTPNWPDKPQSYALAKHLINKPLRPGHEHLLYDGKYRQIVDSARMKKMSEGDVFLD